MCVCVSMVGPVANIFLIREEIYDLGFTNGNDKPHHFFSAPLALLACLLFCTLICPVWPYETSRTSLLSPHVVIQRFILCY